MRAPRFQRLAEGSRPALSRRGYGGDGNLVAGGGVPRHLQDRAAGHVVGARQSHNAAAGRQTEMRLADTEGEALVGSERATFGRQRIDQVLGVVRHRAVERGAH